MNLLKWREFQRGLRREGGRDRARVKNLPFTIFPASFFFFFKKYFFLHDFATMCRPLSLLPRPCSTVFFFYLRLCENYFFARLRFNDFLVDHFFFHFPIFIFHLFDFKIFHVVVEKKSIARKIEPKNFFFKTFSSTKALKRAKQKQKVLFFFFFFANLSKGRFEGPKCLRI